MKPRMKVRWIVAIILASVAAGMLLLTCGVLRWAPIETPAHAAEQTPDPWQGLTKGWILLGFLHDDGSFASPHYYEIVKEPTPEGGSPRHPKSGDRIRLLMPNELIIKDFAKVGPNGVVRSPASGEWRYNLDHYTRVRFQRGAQVTVVEVQYGQPMGNSQGMWALISRFPSK